MSSSAPVGLNPPPPELQENNETSEQSSSVKNKSGQRLLNLVRLLETNVDTPQLEGHFDETVDLLNYLIALYSRRGLLQGDISKANELLSTQTSSAVGKRSKKGQNNNNDLKMHEGVDGDKAQPSTQNHESLLFTAIVRILNWNTPSWDANYALLVALAAELCVAMSQYVKTTWEPNICTVAEYELIAQSGKLLLSGLISKLKFIESEIKSYTSARSEYTSRLFEKCLTLVLWNDELHLDPLISCLKAAISLVTLFGNKLSRSAALLLDLKALGWKFLTIPNQAVQSASSKLLAYIPLAGSTDRKTPSDLWNVAMADVVSMLSTVLATMAPLNKSMAKKDRDISQSSEKIVQGWMSFVREDESDENVRVAAFRIFMSGLTACFNSLLSQDDTAQNKTNILSEIKLDIDAVLDVVESFLSFSLASETVFYKTKKRLRDEVIDDGLLSSRIISFQAANEIKNLGHGILDMLLSSIGGRALLPWARRITRMAYASILTSCSGPVRKVMDPANAVQLVEKKRRWLHLSIPVRSVAINTLKNVTLSFGSDRGNKSGSYDHSSTRCDGELAAALVAGCLIEQINRSTTNDDFDDCWGTFQDRVDLVTTCTECLQAVVVSRGGFLAYQTRELIESVTYTGLHNLKMNTGNSLLGCSPVVVSFLELGQSCISTPWSDGAASGITDTLVQTARRFETCMDNKVSMAALMALRLCDSVLVPRAPALVYVSRAISAASDQSHQASSSASDVIKKINDARAQAVEAKEAFKKAEQARKEKADEKRKRKEEKENESKRLKSEAKAKISKQNDAATSQAVAATHTEADQEMKDAEVSPARPLADDHDTEDKKNDTGKKLVEKDPGQSDDEGSDDNEATNDDSKEVGMEPANEDEDDLPPIFDGGPDSDDE